MEAVESDIEVKREGIFDSYQKRVIKLALKYDVLAIEKSRRIGISWVLAFVACRFAMPAKGARDVYYMGYNLDMARIFIRDTAMFLRAFHKLTLTPKEVFEKDGDQEIKTFRIDLPSGKSIVALPYSAGAFRSKDGVAIIDEARELDKLHDVMDAAMAFTMLGGKVIVLSTQCEIEHPFNEILSDIRSQKRAGFVETITFKDALAGGLYKRICRKNGWTWSPQAEAEYEAKVRFSYGEAGAQELDCIPSHGGSAYLARPTIEAACTRDYIAYRIEVDHAFALKSLEWRASYIADWCQDNLFDVRQRLRPERLTYFGQDYASSPNGDLSVIVPGQFDEFSTLHVPFIIEMRGLPSTEQWLIWDYLLKRCRYACGKLDGRGNGQDTAKYLQDHYGGIDQWEAVMATKNIYLQFMPRMKARIEDRTILLPMTEGVINDLRSVRLVNGVPTIVGKSHDKLSPGKKDHGDRAIGIMNLVAAADEDFAPFDYVEVSDPPRANTHWGEPVYDQFGGADVSDFTMEMY